MKVYRCRAGRRRERGLTLIELLVSVALGLLIVVAALSTFIGSAAAGRMAEAQGRMNEDAQAALAILSQHLRMAGNNPVQPNRAEDTRRNPVYLPSATTSTFTLTDFSVRGCDTKFSNITTATPTFAQLTCDVTSNLPHSIAVNYEADRYNTLPTAANEPTDCVGNALPVGQANLTVVDLPLTVPATTNTAAVTYTVADNRFYLDTGGTHRRSLYCKGVGGATQPLVENIDNLEFRYGLVAPAADDAASIAGYLTASEIPTAPSLAGLSDSERWRLVRAIRICVVAQSEHPVVTDAASARYLRCDGEMEQNPPDLRLRRAYSTTVVIRNRG